MRWSSRSHPSRSTTTASSSCRRSALSWPSNNSGRQVSRRSPGVAPHDGFDASLNRRRTQVDRRSGPVERFAVLWRPGGQDVALADKVFDVCRLFEVERRTRLIRTCCQCPLCEVATLRNGHHGILVAFLDLALLAPTHCNKQSKRDRRCWREAALKTHCGKSVCTMWFTARKLSCCACWREAAR